MHMNTIIEINVQPTIEHIFALIQHNIQLTSHLYPLKHPIQDLSDLIRISPPYTITPIYNNNQRIIKEQSMGRTRRQYYRPHPYNIGSMYKSRRNQFPLLKRNSHHRFRTHNKFSDELTFQTFNSNKIYRIHCHQGYRTENFRGIQYNQCTKDIQSKLIAAKGDEQLFEKFIKSIENKPGPYAMFTGEPLQMWRSNIWKKLARRGSLSPFKGHLKPGTLYKHETVF